MPASSLPVRRFPPARSSRSQRTTCHAVGVPRHLSLRVALDATPLIGVRTGVGAFAFHALEALTAHPELELQAFALTWRGRGELTGLLPKGVRRVCLPMSARPLRMAWQHMDAPVIERWTGRINVVHG